jgi:hypothetical protein
VTRADGVIDAIFARYERFAADDQKHLELIVIGKLPEE